MDTLPPELLIQVFEACVAGASTAHAPLRAVCRYWRDLLAGTPHLWQTLVLAHPARPLPALRAQAAFALAACAPLPFDVRIELGAPDVLDAVLPLLQPCLAPDALGRWRSVSVACGSEEMHYDFPRSIKAPAILEIMLRAPLDAPSVRDCLPAFDAHPRPTDLTVALSASGLGGALALAGALPFARLLLLEDGASGATHPRDVLAFVGASAATLTHLQWQAWPAEFGALEGLPATPLALPALRTLEVSGTLVFRAVLARLHTPALDALVLQNLNVHHPLPGRAPPPEPGDSDDEHADFSQSPWSDHATGMALRSLLARSRPPLRTLEMDYVDMRTKDFVWAFARLPRLTHFRIVGSDMSDTVVGLLRPRPDATVLLPSLTHLDLTGALRLSGDAIVGAIAARERAARDTQAAPALQYLKVARCPGFFPEHEDALSHELGPRFTSN